MITSANIAGQKLVNLNANRAKAPKIDVDENGRLVMRREVVDVITPPEGIEDMGIVEEALGLAQDPERWEMLSSAVLHFQKQLQVGSGVVAKRSRGPNISTEKKKEILLSHLSSATSKEAGLTFAELQELIGGQFIVNRKVLETAFGNAVKFADAPENKQSGRGKRAQVAWMTGVPAAAKKK